MGLPKQVEEAGKRAEDLVKEINEKTAEEKAAPVDAENKPEPAPEPENKEKPQDTGETVEALKHKLSVLQGKYNKEVKEVQADAANLAQLRTDNAQLSSQVVDLSKSISELNGKIEELQEKKEPVKETPAPELTADDLEYLKKQDLDEKTVEILKKVVVVPPSSDPKLAQEVESLKSTVAEVKEETSKVKEDTHQERVAKFWEKVRGEVTDFETINNDPNFINWLAQPVSEHTPDLTLQNVMNDAGNNLDADKAIKLFKKFISETDPGKEDPPPKKEEPNPLENEIEPTSSGSSDPSNIPGKGPTYTTSQVQKFYKDMAQSSPSDFASGPWGGKKKECLAKDADIKKASVEGRIIKG